MEPSKTETKPQEALATRHATLEMGLQNLLDPVEIDADAQKVLERAGAYRDTLMRLVLRQTSVSQWCVFRGEGENARETLYPMGAAAAAMFTFFGLHWSTPGPADELYAADLHTDEDGTRWWLVRSKLWRGSQFVCHAEGKRKIGFGYAKTELDARIDAFENLQSRAARSVFGLGAKSRADFASLGLDLSGARTADFQDHTRAVSDNPDEAVIPFGKSKGQKVSSAPDDDLAWLAAAVKKSVEDPERARFKSKNEALLKAIESEIAKRASKPAETAQEGEEFDKTIQAIREEASVLGVEEKKLDSYIAGLKTLAQAKKALEAYRAKRKTKEPGAEG